jgi:hypothetical protein
MMVVKKYRSSVNEQPRYAINLIIYTRNIILYKIDLCCISQSDIQHIQNILHNGKTP